MYEGGKLPCWIVSLPKEVMFGLVNLLGNWRMKTIHPDAFLDMRVAGFFTPGHLGGVKVGAPEHLVGVGARREVRTPECQIGVGVCVDRILQNSGRRLVEIIDEDPIWRRNPPGCQFCEKIGGIVVLSGDMM